MRVFFFLLAISFGVSILAKAPLEIDFYGTEVHWFALTITSKATEKIPKFTLETESSLSQANLRENAPLLSLKKKMRETLRSKLNQRVESLFFDSEFTVSEYAEKNKRARERLNEFFFQEYEAISINQEKNVFQATATISFLGKRGLLSHIPNQYEKEELPSFQESVLPTPFSGLVVDARHLNIKKALFPRIKSDRGLDIYLPVYVKESYALETGYIHFGEDPLDKENSAIVGKNPFYVVALGVAGKNETDLILATEEAIKLMAHSESRKSLKQCKVLILTSK